MDKIKNLIDKINKQAGSDVLKIASDTEDYGTLTTPFDTVNNLIGGIPIARFTTVAGAEHTGKGAFCLQLIAHQQSLNPDFITLWTDAESSFVPEWAEKLGVDLSRVIIQKYSRTQDTMEKILDSALNIIKNSNLINLWIVDSIGALVPKHDVYDSKDKEKSLEGTNMLHLQRKLGEFYRKANVIISPDKASNYAGCAVVMIGQVYTVPDAYVPLEAVKGGNAVKHWAHLRLMFRRGPKSEWPEKVTITSADGNEYDVYPGWAGRIKVDKTRVNNNEGKEISITFMQNKGFDSFFATINAAFGLKIIQRAGGTYTSDIFPTEKWRGREGVIKFFEDTSKYAVLKDAVSNAAIKEIATKESKEVDNVNEL